MHQVHNIFCNTSCYENGSFRTTWESNACVHNKEWPIVVQNRDTIPAKYVWWFQ